MLDEEKIKLMTRISLYEKNEDINDLAMSKFYKEDYAKYGCLKTLVATTVCYWLCVAVYVLINFQDVLNNLNNMDYFKTISRLMAGYVAAMVVFYIYAFIVYNFKYVKAKKRIIKYNRDLSKLIKLYEKDEAHDQVVKGKVKVYSGIGGDMDDLFEEISEPAPKARPRDPEAINSFEDIDIPEFKNPTPIMNYTEDTNDMEGPIQ